jgi:hypothetical protein
MRPRMTDSHDCIGCGDRLAAGRGCLAVTELIEGQELEHPGNVPAFASP